MLRLYRLLPVLGTAALIGCAEPDTRWAEDVVAADPLFGGGAWFESRLWTDPTTAPAGDPAARSEFLRQRRLEMDEQARDLVLATVDEALARQALTFLVSSTGRAMVDAEAFALAGYPRQPADFPEDMSRRFGDTDSVGEAALRRLSEVRQDSLAGRGGATSPVFVARIVGATRITEDQAPEISAFFRSAVGQRWLDARERVFETAQERFAAFNTAMRERGFARSTVEQDLDALLLPTRFWRDR